MQPIPDIVKSKAVVVRARNIISYSGHDVRWIDECQQYIEFNGFDSSFLNRFVNLEEVNFNGIFGFNDTLLDFSWNDKLRELRFHNVRENECIRAIDLRGCEALTEIWLYNFPNLLSIDLSDCKELKELHLKCIPLTSIDLSFAPNLEKLSILYSNIKYVDLSNNPRIRDFYIDSLEKVTLSRYNTYTESLDWLRKKKIIVEYK